MNIHVDYTYTRVHAYSGVIYTCTRVHEYSGVIYTYTRLHEYSGGYFPVQEKINIQDVIYLYKSTCIFR